MELATEALSYNNQNIASEAPKLLLCSSIVSHQVKQKKDTFVSRYFPILRRTTGNASSNAPILRRNILPVVIPPG